MGAGHSIIGLMAQRDTSRSRILRQAFENTATITVAHHFGDYPLVQVVKRTPSLYGNGLYGASTYGTGPARQVVSPSDITHDSPNQVTVTLASAMTGEVILLG